MKKASCIVTALAWCLCLFAGTGALKPIARIPFDVVGSYVIVPVQINHNPPLRMILDSGFGSTLITELTDQDSLVLDQSYRQQLKGLGIGDSLECWVSTDNTLTVHSFKLTGQQVLALEEDIFNLSRRTGARIHGILGAVFFKDRIVEIAYSRNEIRLYESVGFKPPKGYVPVPLDIYSWKMFLNASIRENGDSTRPVRLLLDTGAELTAWLRCYGEHPVRIPDKHIHSFIGQGLSGQINGAAGRLDEIRIDRFSFKNPVVFFPDSLSTWSSIGQSDREGTLGNQILSRFDMIVDFPGKMLYLKPNHNFKKSFPYNMAGIEIVKNEGDFQLPEVLSVRAGSTGEKAGVQEGDLIVEINGLSGLSASVGEIKNLFESGKGGRITLTLLRKGKRIVLRVPLQKDI